MKKRMTKEILLGALTCLFQMSEVKVKVNREAQLKASSERRTT